MHGILLYCLHKFTVQKHNNKERSKTMRNKAKHKFVRVLDKYVGFCDVKKFKKLKFISQFTISA